MDAIRIQDDLYQFVNHEELEKLEIPSDRPSIGAFNKLDVEVEKLMIGELNAMCKSGEYPNDYLRRACILYKAVKSASRRNKLGFKPALKTLKKIEKLEKVSNLNRYLKDFVLSNLPLPFNIAVEEDMKDTNRHCVMLGGPQTILPDTTYYKEEMAAQKQALLGVWSQMAKRIVAEAGLSEEQQNQYIEDTLKFDAIIATLVKSSEEWSEYTKIYNPTKTSRVCSQLKPIKFKKLLTDLFGFVPEEIIVAEPRFLKGFKTLFNEENFILYKHWAFVTESVGSTGLLSEELRAIGSTYKNMLTGVQEVMPVEKYAYRLAGSYFSEPIGLYYGEKYFGAEAKKDVVEMVKEIIETYKERVKKNDILSEPTKEKAILKLSTMKIKMGYPDFVNKKYDKFVFNESKCLYDIVSELSAIKTLDRFSKLGEKVDKTEWAMPGHMVNACYNPTANDITFPAAILQPPFYSIHQSRSQNLGGIGAVIGHEISHAFDNNGAKCDENGNLNNWWTKEDNKKFNAKTKAMIKEFDGIELPWGKVNATLIVSENIADNGGMAVTLEIMSHTKDANYEEYFCNWARVWCMKAREEYLKLILQIDVHAPTVLRANMQPRNFEEWYKTFDVKKTDKMYLAPNKRVVIW